MNASSPLNERRGSTPLWVVFWIYGVLASHLVFGAILFFYRHMNTTALVLSLFGFVAYTACIMRAVWMNAFNVEKEVYGHIARALTVAWSLNAVMVSGFLFLSHLGAVALPF